MATDQKEAGEGGGAPRGLPLSYAQQRLWFLDQLDPGSAAYVSPLALRLEGALDRAVLQRCLDELVARQGSLRTTFPSSGGEAVQVVAPPGPVTLTALDRTTLASEDKEAEVLRLATEEARRPFDLAQGPLFRATLVRLGPEDHLLLLTMHHIVTDGWSMTVILEELAELYEAFSAGLPSPLEPLEEQYVDAARAQLEQLSGPRLDKELAFWAERLGGIPEVIALPLDRPRPPTQSFRGRRLPLQLPPALLASLKTFSKEEKTTLFATLFTAFQVLLSRYAGQTDVVVGTPIANRNRMELESLVGFFVNTLVMRGDLSGDPSFKEMLGRTRAALVEAMAHGELPFEKLVVHLSPERNLSHNALFQVMFAFQNAPKQVIETEAGLRLRRLPQALESAKFDLTLYLDESSRGLTGYLEYAVDLFDEETIARMGGHLQTLLEGIVADPGQPLSRLPLLTEEERAQLAAFNATAVDHPADRCIHQLFEAQAERSPEAVAVEFEDATLSYRELNRRANQLAHHLKKLGVGPDVMVGVCAERSLEMVVALYAVVKAGGAYVPIDPSYPSDRLTFMLEDAKVPVLLTQARLVDTLPPHGARVLRLDADWDTIATEREDNPTPGPTQTQLAYTIYTSGSTGRPKGAMNSHAGIRNRLQWMQAAYQLGPEDRVLQKTPFSFDVSVWEFFWPLMYGARLVVARPGGHQDPSYLKQLIREAGVTTLHFVPSMLAVFLEEPGIEACTSLRQVMCSGEALPLEVTQRFYARLQQAELHNLYGPTEAAVDVTACTIERAPKRPMVSIGRPIHNIQIHMLDPHLSEVPIGVAGELHIGGIGLARGYHNRPELTAEKFIPNPFVPGERLYKTGDLARWLPDGSIEYLGRIDHQVKIRGFRIELGEIEAVLGQAPGVREAVVVALEGAGGDKRLVAYVVLDRAAPPDSAELRAALKDKLPEFMVPSTFVPLEVMPLSPNGKVDRKALPRPSAEPLERAAYVAPRTPTEEKLAALWAEVLGIEQVGAEDDFFELGGHSLLATRLTAKVRGAFAVELQLRDFFRAPKVAAVGRLIDAAPRLTSKEVALEPVSRAAPLPLSFGQERQFGSWQREPENPFFHLAKAARLSGALDAEALRLSLDALVVRHESLRTSFQVIDGRPVQVVLPAAPRPLPIEELPAGSSEAELSARIAAEVRRPFDLGAGEVARARLLRLSAEDHVLVIAMHHVVTDGWSMGVYFRELAALYADRLVGRSSQLPPLAIQYPDFAAWQRRWLAGERLAAEVAHWKGVLEGSPESLPLPVDRRPAVEDITEGKEARLLPAALYRGLEALARSYGCTPFMVLLAGFDALLYAETGQADVVVGTPIDLRSRAETQHLVGYFINHLALRVSCSGDPSFAQLLERVRATCLEAYAHQDLPNTALGLDLRRFYQVRFNFVPAVPAIRLGEVDVRYVPAELGKTRFELALYLAEREEGLLATMRYQSALFDAATIRRLLARYQALLEAALADPAQQLGACLATSRNPKEHA